MNKRLIIHKKDSVNTLSQKERLRLFEESIAMINNSQIPSESFEQANEFECASEGL